MIVEKHIVIEGNHQLKGELEVKGAKNAVLKQMVLPILAEGDYTLTNVPNITDVSYMQEVLDVLGLKTELTDNKLNIHSPQKYEGGIMASKMEREALSNVLKGRFIDSFRIFEKN